MRYERRITQLSARLTVSPWYRNQLGFTGVVHVKNVKIQSDKTCTILVYLTNDCGTDGIADNIGVLVPVRHQETERADEHTGPKVVRVPVPALGTQSMTRQYQSSWEDSVPRVTAVGLNY